MTETQSYTRLAAALRAIDADVSAAGAQGMLCGLFCSPNEPEAAQWIAQVLEGLSPKGDAAREVLEALTETYQDTQERLRNDSLEFEPLLPDDEAPLAERAQALGQWCEGLLFGLGVAGSHQPAELPREANEVVNDLTEIARVDTDLTADEDNEMAFTELVEYLRAATLLLREHTALPSSARPAAGTKPAGGDFLDGPDV
jgi:hypothetical protein